MKEETKETKRIKKIIAREKKRIRKKRSELENRIKKRLPTTSQKIL